MTMRGVGMSFTDRYSLIDRMLHRLAFVTRPAQAALADIESSLLSAKLREIRVDRPVFVTGLPRAGTTVLLELLVGTGEFASHKYRDMPFVMLPMLWSRFSRRFLRQDERRERAHGDGILIDLDSPEAFEEILWLTFWPRQYLEDQVMPWGVHRDAEFEHAFREHIRKIIALRGAEVPTARRYVSKDNLNIARIEYLTKVFPDADIIIPFRSPIQHAASLLKQHMNFLRIHSEDPFAGEYMKGLGHFDFGVNLRPVNFKDWLASSARLHSTFEFWLDYWFATYDYLNDTCAQRIHFVCYDRLCSNPRNSLNALASTLGMKDQERLVAQSARLAPPKPHEEATQMGSAEVSARAEELYRKLCDRDQITRS